MIPGRIEVNTISLTIVSMKKINLIILFCLSVYVGIGQAKTNEINHPNVLILYTDDLGYGDLSCYGAEAISTPNIDRLAQNGVRFTDAHCTASTCTPSRFSLLSGRYAWRKTGTNILPGNANLTIPTNITTLPKIFQMAGYQTGVVGKWHLGLGDSFPIDWSKEVTPGPREIGFDYSFIFPATADRTPTVFLENQQVLGMDPNDPIEVSYEHPFDGELLGKDHPELLKMKNDPRQGHDQHITNGIGRIGYMTGGKTAQWTDEELAFSFNSKAIDFIDRSQKQNKPFFLYYAIHNIHVPRMPGSIFKGQSKLGFRGDVILEMDYSVGVIMEELRNRGLLENTLVIFSSDNGPVVNDGYLDNSVETTLATGHKPAGVFRGGKYSAFEGGTRVPFIVYWPKEIRSGSVSPALFSQVDLLASFADMLGVSLPPKEFTDSRNYFNTLIGKENQSRDHIVEQPLNKEALAIVKDGWKYISPANGEPLMVDVNIETGYSNQEQLYNLNNDPAETKNLASQYPQKVKELKALLQKEKERF